MRTRQEVESKLKELRRKSFHTDLDLGQISILLWIAESWDWETEKAQLESRLRVTEVQSNKGAVH